MNNILERIQHNFSESIQTKINTIDTISDAIAQASEKIIQALLEGHKVMSCGNGSSACQALHFASSMLNRFRQERPSLPAIALTSDISTLTAIANDYHYNDVFAKQVRALGQPGDLLLAISTSGNSGNMLHAIRAAQDKKSNVVALTGHDGGKMADLIQETDIEIRVQAYDSARIQETHLLIIHCLSDIVDYQLFGHGEIVK